MSRWTRRLHSWWSAEVDLGHALLVMLLIALVLLAAYIGANMRP